MMVEDEKIDEDEDGAVDEDRWSRVYAVDAVEDDADDEDDDWVKADAETKVLLLESCILIIYSISLQESRTSFK